MHVFDTSLSCARTRDAQDSLAEFRNQFLFPQHKGEKALYFVGNSLGLQPENTKSFFKQELDDWAKYGVEGHFKAGNPWVDYHSSFAKPLAKIVGALPHEVVVMNTLTANLHFLMVSFYRPKGKKVKILCEQKPFPSDRFVLESQIKFHGLDPKECIIEVEQTSEDYDGEMVQAIERHKDEIALIFVGGVNYYTGRCFDLKQLAQTANKHNICIGYDLAHAAGNTTLELHDWGVDFAAWCSYKYLNAGPGAVSGVFIHEKHHKDQSLPKFTGWWGHNAKTRFAMGNTFDPILTAESWQTSNAPVFNMVGLKASLELFENAGFQNIIDKRIELNNYALFLFEALINNSVPIKIITPKAQASRASQLSLYIDQNGKKLFEHLTENGVYSDWREPNVIRLATVGLYNSFEDIYKLYQLIKAFYTC